MQLLELKMQFTLENVNILFDIRPFNQNFVEKIQHNLNYITFLIRYNLLNYFLFFFADSFGGSQPFHSVWPFSFMMKPDVSTCVATPVAGWNRKHIIKQPKPLKHQKYLFVMAASSNKKQKQNYTPTTIKKNITKYLSLCVCKRNLSPPYPHSHSCPYQIAPISSPHITQTPQGSAKLGQFSSQQVEKSLGFVRKLRLL